MSMGGAVALDILAVESALRITGVSKGDRPHLTEQLLAIGNVILNELHTEQDALEQAAKSGRKAG